MTSIFKKPKVSKVNIPDAPPPVPERSDSDVASLASSQRDKFFRGGGRSSTSFTGGLGTGGGESVMRFLGGTGRK